MSYARFSHADVYVYLDCYGSLCCCGCRLHERPFGSYHFETTAEMLEHLEQHRAAGHDVPDECIAELRADAEENDRWIAAYRAGDPTAREGEK